ncbi:MAG: hypothetical protein SFV23_25205 [Planctomycetaceae bacterium]|nr:hypothetical protein [Planctomycetaceae bacterium]
MMVVWWRRTSGSQLAQGDLLPECQLPLFPGDWDRGQPTEEEVLSARLIVMTQSCDLVNRKAEHVALCPIHTLGEFESANPSFAKKGAWEAVRKGRMEGLHLLASPESPDNNRSAFVVNFGQIISLPLDYLEQYASSVGDRWRLESPFLEHFSQAFARFFMRVGLPAGLEPYK